MKTIRLLFVLAFVFSTALQLAAQDRLGIISGSNISNFNSNVVGDNFDTRTGFVVGGVLDFAINRIIGLHFTPLLIQKGAKQTVVDDPDFGNAEIIFKVTYFEVPAFLKIGPSTGSIRPYGLAGPVLGVNVSAKREARGDRKTRAGIQENDYEDIANIDAAIEIFDVGIGGGGGVSFPINKFVLFIEGRYTISVINIHHDARVGFAGDTFGLRGDLRNKSIQIVAGFSF